MIFEKNVEYFSWNRPGYKQWRRKVPKSVCVEGGGGGGGHTHTYMYVPSVKNQYKRDVIEYMVIYVMVIEHFHN